MPPAAEANSAARPGLDEMSRVTTTVTDPPRPVTPVRRRAHRTREISTEELAELLREYRVTGDRRIRNRIVESQMHLVEHYVIRYRRPGRAEPDDLRQTALMALVGAVDRFDDRFGASLQTFAARTIEGELKRFLRDRTWLVRPPRSTQEVHLRVRRAMEELSHELTRSPTTAEIAERLGEPVETVILGLVAAAQRDGESISRRRRDEDSPQLEDALSCTDDGFDLTEQRIVLRDAVHELEERHLRILRLRYLDEMTQPEIAEAIGVSQSYVSRLLRDGLATLRREFER